MEVHAHTHSSPDSHRDKRKKWTHYFWEFLMLFLAVFCGFLAEYKLEHMIEHQREKKYAQTLYEDLKRFGTRATTVSLQDATLQQLLSSGGLRYFIKHNVVYAIADN